MWRGHVRASRKFKQSLRRLIEEMSWQSSGNDRLWKREWLSCLRRTSRQFELDWGGRRDATGPQVGADERCWAAEGKRNLKKWIQPWERIMIRKWLRVEGVWSRFGAISGKLGLPRKQFFNCLTFLSQCGCVSNTCSCEYCFPFSLFSILSSLSLAAIKSSLKLM